MDKKEITVYARDGIGKYRKDGHFVDMPKDWEFVPSGDATLTRRLKSQATGYWVVRKIFGRKEFTIGLCVSSSLASSVRLELEAERLTPEYQQKLASGRQRRQRAQARYQEDFASAVLAFLSFHERWRELALRLAAVVTEFATPVGSGTVARTQRISIEERARAAVIAWMRHNTTDYEQRHIPKIAGKRRSVRRELAQESLRLLENYRRGADAPPNCPLQHALQHTAKEEAPPAVEASSPASASSPPSISAGDSFWL